MRAQKRLQSIGYAKSENYNVEKKEISYDTYKGSRNLKNRSNKVMEIMYVITMRK